MMIIMTIIMAPSRGVVVGAWRKNGAGVAIPNNHNHSQPPV